MEPFFKLSKTESRRWSENFRIPQPRQMEFTHAIAPMLRKYAHDESYRISDLATDITTLATTVDEVAWLCFEAGRLNVLLNDANKETVLELALQAENDNGDCNCPRCKMERGEINVGDMISEALGIKRDSVNKEKKAAMLKEVEEALEKNFGDKVKIRFNESSSNPSLSFSLAAKDRSLLNAEFQYKVNEVIKPILDRYDFFSVGMDSNSGRDPFAEMFNTKRPRAEA